MPPRLVRVAPLAALVLVVACGVAPSSAPPATGTTTFNEGGLAFKYPAAWQEFHYTVQSSFSDVIAYLATVNVPEPCATTVASDSTSVDCEDRFTLTEDTLVVDVMSNGFPGFDITHVPSDATALTIGGLPGYVETNGPDAAVPGVDRTVTWTIAAPGFVDNYYTIYAQLRGPDLAGLQGQLDALIASLRYDPPITPLPAGSDAATAALAQALASQVQNDPSWACFPPTGTRQMLVSSIPGGTALAAPQVATCTTQITATPLALWRADLTLRLPQADPQAGHGEAVTLWVGPDGYVGQQLSPIP
ncbi:MAG TPA: hypothetical protein VN771_03995 [Candidatus Baltobacteraceae bacterium]|nr:hypothetical protein [Candidatus Baltobacteraceae bacterium]